VQGTGSLLPSTVKNASSVSSCSKAPRGLFVHVCVGRIFTANSISPGNGSRQLLSRSTFRAGRNLPDKELRYHRTVHIVIKTIGYVSHNRLWGRTISSLFVILAHARIFFWIRFPLSREWHKSMAYSLWGLLDKIEVACWLSPLKHFYWINFKFCIVILIFDFCILNLSSSFRYMGRSSK